MLNKVDCVSVCVFREGLASRVNVDSCQPIKLTKTRDALSDTVDLVTLASFLFLQISRGGQIREFKNLAKIIIIIAPLKKNENLRILNSWTVSK